MPKGDWRDGRWQLSGVDWPRGAPAWPEAETSYVIIEILKLRRGVGRQAPFSFI